MWEPTQARLQRCRGVQMDRGNGRTTGRCASIYHGAGLDYDHSSCFHRVQKLDAQKSQVFRYRHHGPCRYGKHGLYSQYRVQRPRIHLVPK